MTLPRSTPASLIVRGVLAIIVGLVAIAWPGITVLALVLLFGVYAFVDAGLQIMRAFDSKSLGPVFGHLLLAAIGVVAGLLAVLWPAPTAFVLVLIIAVWALAGGLAEVGAAFRSGEAASARAMFVLTGLISVAFGIALLARPGVGALTLALLFGLFSLIFGASRITLGVHMHQLNRRPTA